VDKNELIIDSEVKGYSQGMTKYGQTVGGVRIDGSSSSSV